MPETIPFNPDPDEPGIPVAGFKHSGYPRGQVKEGMLIRLQHHPVPGYPHAIQFVDEAGASLGFVPDNLAKVMAAAVYSNELDTQLHVAEVRDNGLAGIEIWVTGVLTIIDT